jgi:hypothetical protein
MAVVAGTAAQRPADHRDRDDEGDNQRGCRENAGGN